MKLTQLSKHVYKCAFTIQMPISVPINVWFIQNGDDIYIVDTGVQQLVDQQMKAALSLGTPKAILLTHGHNDHIGGVAKWLEKYDLPVYAHEKELPYIDGEIPYPKKDSPENTGVAGKVQPLTEEILQHTPIRFYHTPGHAPGHVVYHHEVDNILLAGDLFITTSEKLHPPVARFTSYMKENIDSGAIVEQLKPDRISSSHGQDLVGYSDELYPIYVFHYRELD